MTSRIIFVLSGPNLDLLGQPRSRVAGRERDPFRHYSFVAAKAAGLIAGFGTQGHTLALRRAATLLDAAA